MCVSECLTLRAPCIAWFLSGSAAPSMMCICMARRIPIDRDPFCASILALLFLQLAQSLDLLPLIQAGCFLCGTFGLDPSVPSGLMGRTPLTSPRRIGAYLERCPGHDGLARAREALRFVCAEAASPPEVFMRLVLGLPARLGGFGLSGSVMNRRIKPSKRAKALAGRESLVPDLYLPDCKLDIEFDSNAEHLTARQATLDATKRMALESDGLKVIGYAPRRPGGARKTRHAITLALQELRIKAKTTLSAEMVHGRLSRRGGGCGAAVLLSVKRAARRGVLAGVPSHGL